MATSAFYCAIACSTSQTLYFFDTYFVSGITDFPVFSSTDFPECDHPADLLKWLLLHSTAPLPVRPARRSTFSPETRRVKFVCDWPADLLLHSTASSPVRPGVSLCNLFIMARWRTKVLFLGPSFVRRALPYFLYISVTNLHLTTDKHTHDTVSLRGYGGSFTPCILFGQASLVRVLCGFSHSFRHSFVRRALPYFCIDLLPAFISPNFHLATDKHTHDTVSLRGYGGSCTPCIPFGQATLVRVLCGFSHSFRRAATHIPGPLRLFPFLCYSSIAIQ